MLLSRAPQCLAVDSVIAAVRAGGSRSLVVFGEPGIGKTALLNYAADSAPGFVVLRAEGVESEMELPFAALHQLCAQTIERAGALPPPQRAALDVAFGLSTGEPPDRFLVSLAVLSLLSEVAADRPVLCLIDDAQWLDRTSAQVLAFIARRLGRDSIGLVFGIRDPDTATVTTGLPQLAISGLSDADGRALLASALPGRLDERVRDRILAEAGGNPLALLELSRAITVADLAGGFGVVRAPTLTGRIEQIFLRRIAPLPEETRRVLLLAAAEPVGDPALLMRAVASVDISADATDPAEADGLLTIAGKVAFRHPLIRAAIYKAASAADRRSAHHTLAKCIDPAADPDRRAWHLALAVAGPDENIASELEQCAGRASARGGLAAAAAFLERSAALTLGPHAKAARALAAAQLTYEAGMPDLALEQAATAEAGALSELERAHFERLRARIAFTRRRGSDAPSLILHAARRMGPLDVSLARETYLEALWAAIRTGRSEGGMLLEAALAARSAPLASNPPRAVDLLLDGLVARSIEGYSAGVPKLRLALRALQSEDNADDAGWLWLGCHTAMDLWDDETCRELAARHVQYARDAGALTTLPFGLNYVAAHHIFAGEFREAATLLEEANTITAVTGNAPMADFSLLLAGWRGHASDQFEAAIEDAKTRGEGLAMANAEFATAVLHNGLGHYEAALTAAQQACEHDELGFGVWVLPELVEAAAHCVRPDIAAKALAELTERTRLSNNPWARGIEARSRALVTDREGAERHFEEAIHHLADSRMTVHLARAHLIYGEWLRRQNRRTDSRSQLHTALEMLTAMGADGFAERAVRELRATGERIQRGRSFDPSRLTNREAQIARLVADGFTNQQVAAQLFVSRRTVEYHLHKIFSKLDITSRHQLHSALGVDATRPHAKSR